MTWLDYVSASASVATAFAVFLAWYQIRQARKQAVTAFEDQLASQYRALIQQLPIQVLLSEPTPPEQVRALLYHYIDLTNEQVFLRRMNRVSEETWHNWREGILEHLSRPAFYEAWTIWKERLPQSVFQDLRALEHYGFATDPRRWRPATRRLQVAVPSLSSAGP